MATKHHQFFTTESLPGTTAHPQTAKPPPPRPPAARGAAAAALGFSRNRYATGQAIAQQRRFWSNPVGSNVVLHRPTSTTCLFPTSIANGLGWACRVSQRRRSLRWQARTLPRCAFERQHWLTLLPSFSLGIGVQCAANAMRRLPLGHSKFRPLPSLLHQSPPHPLILLS